MASSGKTSTFIKQEPNLAIKQESGTVKPERLSSFRLPRDLTLGGLVPARIVRNTVNKKVYTPNLNATRNKNSDVKTSRDTTNLGRGRGRGRERGGRGGGNRGGAKNSSLVQTSGLFSEGSGESKLRRSSSVFDKHSSADTASSLKRPTIVKREVKLDPEVERKHIRDILGDDSEDVDEPMECFASSIDSFKPIILKEVKTEIKTEEENAVKHESTPAQYPISLSEFFDRKTPQLFLLQLPDTLPGHGPDSEPAESAEAEMAAAKDNQQTGNFCTVRQLDEGLFGKIVRYRSGKTKLVIGETRFDIDLGMDPGLLQDVISINTNRTERSGNLINLGQIESKLSAIPDWEYIFSKL